ncbi:MAG TPA: FAD-dependent oxidoreductase [Thermotogota bacterium]|nr:FAD-dependent oxidoreductase [Thermotogota bacterium]
MITCDLLVIGGGPAGISAAVAAGKAGLKVLLLEERERLGGQLTKQTHRFFGSVAERAGTRGIAIIKDLETVVAQLENVEVSLSTTALGIYEDGVSTALKSGKMIKIKPKAIVVATGAFEKFLPFENNDLPGVYGAGAVQTLMNIYGVLPARRILMIGSGNIGLIVSYQLVQAGAEVVGVIEASPKIGGYLVHASKIRRLGIPIYPSCTIKKAFGQDRVAGAELVRLDEKWKEIPGSQFTVDCDAICLAVGLNPLIDLLGQSGCQFKYIPELGGQVPIRDESMRTNVPHLYIAGDLSSIEEATAALLEGELAGLSAAKQIRPGQSLEARIEEVKTHLRALRSGPVGEKIRSGLSKLTGEALPTPSPRTNAIDELSRTGIASPANLAGVLPDEKRKKSRAYAVIECYQQIPCDPCVHNCPFGAIKPFSDINDLPIVDFDLCTGCGQCIGRCPGLAIFTVDETRDGDRAKITLPYEFLPKPVREEMVDLLDRSGKCVGQGVVKSVLNTPKQDKTTIVTVEIHRNLVQDVRQIRVVQKS